jgi:hypothetical protein
MSAKEYNLWRADYLIEPWGEERADIRVGLVTQSIRAANSKDPVNLKDCIMDYNIEPAKPMAWEDMRDACAAHAKAMNRKR